MQRKIAGLVVITLTIIASFAANAGQRQCEFGDVKFKASGFRYNHTTGNLVQKITIENTSQRVLRGSGYLVFDGLDDRVSALGVENSPPNGKGGNRAIRLSGNQGKEFALSPREKMSSLIHWQPISEAKVNYKPRLLICEDGG